MDDGAQNKVGTRSVLFVPEWLSAVPLPWSQRTPRTRSTRGIMISSMACVAVEVVVIVVAVGVAIVGVAIVGVGAVGGVGAGGGGQLRRGQ